MAEKEFEALDFYLKVEEEAIKELDRLYEMEATHTATAIRLATIFSKDFEILNKLYPAIYEEIINYNMIDGIECDPHFIEVKDIFFYGKYAGRQRIGFQLQTIQNTSGNFMFTYHFNPSDDTYIGHFNQIRLVKKDERKWLINFSGD